MKRELESQLFPVRSLARNQGTLVPCLTRTVIHRPRHRHTSGPLDHALSKAASTEEACAGSASAGKCGGGMGGVDVVVGDCCRFDASRIAAATGVGGACCEHDSLIAAAPGALSLASITDEVAAAMGTNSGEKNEKGVPGDTAGADGERGGSRRGDGVLS